MQLAPAHFQIYSSRTFRRFPCSSPWFLMVPANSPWLSFVIRGYPWLSFVILGYPWLYVVILASVIPAYLRFKYMWNHLRIYNYPSRHLRGYPWLYLVIYDSNICEIICVFAIIFPIHYKDNISLLDIKMSLISKNRGKDI